MKKIYIAGCGGMLGEAFYKQFKDEYELKVAGNPAKIIKTGIIMNERAEWENWPGLQKNNRNFK